MSLPSSGRARLPLSRIVGTGVAWALALFLAIFSVLDLVHCLLLAGCATALLVAWPHSLPPPPRLPDLPHHTHLGARRDLADLSWSATERDGSASVRALSRVRALADATGVDTVRHEIDHDPSPSLPQVFNWLDSIDEKVKYD